MIVVMVPARMVPVMVVILLSEQPRTEQVNPESERRDCDGLAVCNGNRADKPDGTFIGNLDRYQRENDGARKSGKITEFARSESEARVTCMLARGDIRQPSDAESRRMAGHVPAVSQQRHRTGESAADNFRDHHNGRKGDHKPCPPFILGMPFSEKNVLVRLLVDGMGVHGVGPA